MYVYLSRPGSGCRTAFRFPARLAHPEKESRLPIDGNAILTSERTRTSKSPKMSCWKDVRSVWANYNIIRTILEDYGACFNWNRICRFRPARSSRARTPFHNSRISLIVKHGTLQDLPA